MPRLAALVVALVLAGCLGQDPAPPAGTPPTSRPPDVTPPPAATTPAPGEEPADPAGARELAAAQTQFGLDLARRLAAAQPGENLFLSPVSAAVALAMARAGAQGETLEAMTRALRLEGLDGARVDEQHRALLLALQRDTGNLTVRVADAAFVHEEFEPRAEYLQRIEREYRSDLLVRDFRDPATVDDVNGWVDEKTSGKIPRLIDRILPDEVMLLVNTVYFRGQWALPYDVGCTREHPFTREDGSTVQVPMMCRAQANAQWGEADGATVARLGYREADVAMYVVLPPEGESVAQRLARWDAMTLAAALQAPTRADGLVEMPRLAMRTDMDLKEPLEEMGMGVAFTDRADLSGIAGEPGDLYITRVKQVALLEVDENGTEAAAATVVGVGVTSLPPPPTRIVLDRPYLVLIRDDATGALLFLGAVHDPTAAA